MLCLGFFSVQAQVLFVREMLVVFLGNELSIAVLLASWLLGIGAGALAAGFFVDRFRSPRRLRVVLGAFVLAPGLLLPAQVLLVRGLRGVLDMPVGEYSPIGVVLGSAVLLFLPLCVCVGCCFPFACRVLACGGPGDAQKAMPGAGSGADEASRVYAIEAAGSMAGGAVLTYGLLPVLTPVQMVLLASAVAVAGSAVAAPLRIWRGLGIVTASTVLSLAFLSPEGAGMIEDAAVRLRWRAFGVLRGGETRLVASTDTVYQNLAVTESYDQYTLYANGQVHFSFPDPIADEHAAHFVMAQNPAAKRVLVLGGNPAGQIPEILKYPVERVVHVDLDPGVGRLLSQVLAGDYAKVVDDPRTEFVPGDAPRFVKRTTNRFDIVWINAPDPGTAGDNRFHSVDFFREVRDVLSPSGFLVSGVTSSERLQEGPVQLGAAVYRALKEVFPVVLVTAEAENRFLAGMDGGSSGITLHGETLYRRSRGAAVPTRYFRPEYFRFADELMPEKTRYVTSRFESTAVPLNTNLRPVAYLYNLVLWSRYSGSGIGRLLQSMQGVRTLPLVCGIAAAGLAALAGGLLVRLLSGAGGGARDRWARAMAGILIGSTGFSGMALEIALLLVFQGLYGYVYTRMGLIVAVFMLGLVAGAPCGKWLARGGSAHCWRALGFVELLLFLVALGIPRLASLAARPDATYALQVFVEVGIHAVIVLVGWAVGAEFPLGNRVFCDAGGTVGTAAAITDASDHLGAAAGALVTGVLLVPVYGVANACLLIAVLKAVGIAMAGSGTLVSLPSTPTRRGS